MSDGSAGKEKPLNDRGLATRLKPYGIRSRSVRIGDLHRKGYMVEDFFDAWARYCPSASDERDKRDKRDIFDNQNNFVLDVPDVPEGVAERQEAGLPDVPPFPVRRK